MNWLNVKSLFEPFQLSPPSPLSLMLISADGSLATVQLAPDDFDVGPFTVTNKKAIVFPSVCPSSPIIGAILCNQSFIVATIHLEGNFPVGESYSVRLGPGEVCLDLPEFDDE